ncbi:MAG: hypothetical protein AAF242_18965 [Bacteroidota bacterium]
MAHTSLTVVFGVGDFGVVMNLWTGVTSTGEPFVLDRVAISSCLALDRVAISMLSQKAWPLCLPESQENFAADFLSGTLEV